MLIGMDAAVRTGDNQSRGRDPNPRTVGCIPSGDRDPCLRPQTLTRASSHLGRFQMAYTLSEVTESVGTITLDNERRRNALSRPLVDEVIAALRSFQMEKVR